MSETASANELEVAQALVRSYRSKVKPSIEFVRAANDLLLTTTIERRVPAIWNARMERFLAAADAMRDAALATPG